MKLDMENVYHLLINCKDEKGLIFRVTKTILSQDLNIINNLEFVEKETSRFFMRTEISGKLDKHKLETELIKELPGDARLVITKRRKKEVVVLVTKEYHCLGDLLTRNHFGELNANINAVISNHKVLENFTSRFNVPFHYIPHENKSRKEHEKELLDVINSYNPEFVILAKYMRILSPDFIDHFKDHIINIHHSFLPAFAGANPYRQAFERGVKIIGATSHYVTGDLDQGPIIAQGTSEITHRDNVRELIRKGRDLERLVLARALKLHSEHRVLVHGHKTVVFE